MIGISRKVTDEAPIVNALAMFSHNYYGEDEAGELHTFFAAIDKLRKEMSKATTFETTLCVLEEYLQALDLLDHGFPFGEGDNVVNLVTTWHNHLAKKTKGSWSNQETRDSTSMSSISFERACAVFNIAATHAVEGANHEDNKVAIQRLQRAAAIFNLIRDQLIEQIPIATTCDLQEVGLNMASSICLGYAQKKFYLHAKTDNLPAGLLAKLANQVAEFFNAAHANAKKMSGAIAPVYGEALQAMASTYHASALAHAASVSKVESEKNMSGFGMCVAKHKLALKVANEAQKALNATSYFDNADEKNEIEDLISRITSECKLVENDNDSAYMEIVPSEESVPPLGKIATVKVQPNITLESLYEEKREICKFQQLVEHLLPEEVLEFVQDFYIRLESLVSVLDDEQRKYQKEVEEMMHDFNLPFCLDDSSNPGLPEHLSSKITDVQQRGGVAALQAHLTKIQESDLSISQIIQRAEENLVKEAEDDNNMRNRFQARWARVQSSSLNGALYNQLRSTMAQIQQVRGQNPSVQINAIVTSVGQILEKTHAEIEATLPEPTPISQDSTLVLSVRENLDRLLENMSSASSASDSCKAQIIDYSIEGHLLQAHSHGMSLEQVVNDRINELDELRTSTSKNLKRLDSYIQSLRDAFGKYKAAQGAQLSPRVAALSDIDSKATSILQCFNDLSERLNYYKRMIGHASSLESQVTAFINSRNEEKLNLLNSVTQAITQPETQFQGVMIEEFGLGPLGIKIGYEEGKGWRVNEVKPDGEVAKAFGRTKLAEGALVVCIDDYDLRNEPDVSGVLQSNRGTSRKVIFVPSIQQPRSMAIPMSPGSMSPQNNTIGAIPGGLPLDLPPTAIPSAPMMAPEPSLSSPRGMYPS